MNKIGQFDVQTQQLFALASIPSEIAECPIFCETMEDPYTTSCGHTFNHHHIVQSLEYSNKCPMDRQVITRDTLVPNLFAKKFIDNEINFLFLTKKIASSQYDCPITRRPNLNAIKLQTCGHTFSKTGLENWIKKNVHRCPICNEEFKESDIVQDDITRALVGAEYPIYREKIRTINKNLESKVIKLKLDDRDQYIQELSKMKTCPISQKDIQSPVLGSCGHTFDAQSIKENASCPFDHTQLDPKKIVPNIIAKDILQALNENNPEATKKLEAFELQARCGVLLFLQPNTTPERVFTIAKALEVFPRWSYEEPLLRIGEYHYSKDQLLSEVNQIVHLDNGIPVADIL